MKVLILAIELKQLISSSITTYKLKVDDLQHWLSVNHVSK